MGNNEIGEHSRKTSHNGDGDRPLKKARYVWQLKGKYHLKDSCKQSNINGEMQEGSSRVAEVDINEREGINSNNNNGANANNNNNCNKCCLDTLLARSNALLESDDLSDQEITPCNIDRSISEEIPVTLVKPNPKKDDFLHKWQARQVAKSFVDNTINSILEQWKLAPVDAADFVENCDSGGQVEDEGILMAIQSHGLQSNRYQSSPFECMPIMDGESAVSCCELNPAVDKNAPVSFVQAPGIDESTLDNYENAHNEIIKQKTTDAEMSYESDVDKAINENNLQMGDPMDFLSAAVSVAIQKKGLSSYNYG